MRIFCQSFDLKWPAGNDYIVLTRITSIYLNSFGSNKVFQFGRNDSCYFSIQYVKLVFQKNFQIEMVHNSHLYPCFGEPRWLSQLLARINIRIMSATKWTLQGIQLLTGECGTRSSLLAFQRYAWLRFGIAWIWTTACRKKRIHMKCRWFRCFFPPTQIKQTK